jgi:undecaprenyl pyrophosphate synthase
MEKGKVMYNVSVKRNMEIDLEAAGNIVAQVLKEDFEFVCQELHELKHKMGNLKDFEIEDFKRNAEVHDAMKILLGYYMTKGEYDEFMELQRVYGNVE